MQIQENEEYLIVFCIGFYGNTSLFFIFSIMEKFPCFFCRCIYFYQLLYAVPKSSGLYLRPPSRQQDPYKQLDLTCTHVRMISLSLRSHSADPRPHIRSSTRLYHMSGVQAHKTEFKTLPALFSSTSIVLGVSEGPIIHHIGQTTHQVIIFCL